MRRLLFGAFFASCLVGCATTTTNRLGLPPLVALPHLDLQRYLGRWYEIARFSERFEAACFGPTATYTLRSDGGVDVLNACHRGSPEGPEESIHGRARVVDVAEPAKLEVSFFRPFWADYWVLEIGDSYEYAVVGHPSRDHLWILSRTPRMEPATYDAILQRLTAVGYDTGRLLRQVPVDAP